MGGDKKCVLCGSEKTVYKNCGVLSCNNCVSFFRTAIIGGLKPCDDKCTENGRCCKLKKCKEKGMDESRIGIRKRDGSSAKEKVAEVCSICDKDKTKVAYSCGVMCCNACQLFFRRAMENEGNIEPCDIKNGKCVKDKCRSCRLQNCKKKGMVSFGYITPKNRVDVTRIDQAIEQDEAYPSDIDTENDNLNQTKSKSHKSSITEACKVCNVCDETNEVKHSYGVLCCSDCSSFFRSAVTGEVVINPCIVENEKCIIEDCKSCKLKNCKNKGMNESDGSRIDQVPDQASVADEAHSSDTNAVENNQDQIDSRSHKVNNVSFDDTESNIDVSLSKISLNKINLKSVQKHLEELEQVLSNFQEREKEFINSKREYQMRENVKNEKIHELQLELEKSKELTNKLTVERNNMLIQFDKLKKDLQEATCENQKTDLLAAVQTQSLDVIRKLVEQKGIPIDDKWTDYKVLVEALKIGKTDVAQYLLERNCRVNKTEISSTPADTPLHLAVKLKDTDLVKWLLKKKASIDIVNAEGDSPLHLAFIYKQSNILDLLLAYMKENDIYMNSVNQHGLSHLHIACTREDKEIIKQLLTKGASISQSVNENSLLWSGFTAMHFAVYFKSTEAVTVMTSAMKKLKLTQKNDIESSCTKLLHKDTEKSLIIADLISPTCYGKILASAIMRMNTGRDNDRSIYPFSPLHLAIESDCTEYVESVLMDNADIDDCHHEIMPLHLALYREETSQSKEIFNKVYNAAKKTEKNHTDVNGLSYLHVAVTRNDLATVEHYLDAGNNVNSQVTYVEKQFYHFSPLHFAVWYESKEMAKLLIDRGANVNLSDDGKHGTPLHMAIAVGNVELIELLLKSGADVKAVQPRDHQTVLHKLMHCLQTTRESQLQNNLLRYINRFVQMGCDVNAHDINGNTALSDCDMYDEYFSLKCLLHLLECGADINLLNCSGDTPLERMSSAGRDNCEFIMVLYEHTEKLKALGTMLRPKNVEICQKYLERMKSCKNHAAEFGEKLNRADKERLDEIDKLKEPFFSNCRNSTLYYLLNSEPKFIDTIFSVSFLENILEDRDFEKNYPSFGYLIRLQCHRFFQFKGIKASLKRAADEPLEYEQSAKHLRT